MYLKEKIIIKYKEKSIQGIIDWLKKSSPFGNQ